MRVFVLNDKVLNADNNMDAEQLLKSGARELPPQEISMIFGELAHFASPNHTVVNPDGTIIFTPPKETALPTEAELTQQRIAEIQNLLTANDLASVRPLRAKLAGTATEFDDARLAELEEQAQALRTELATLTTKLEELSDQPTE